MAGTLTRIFFCALVIKCDAEYGLGKKFSITVVYFVEH